MSLGVNDESDSQERRVSPRLVVQLGARLIAASPDPALPPFVSVCVAELSIGGCQLIADRDLAIGSQWFLRFDEQGLEAAQTPVRIVRTVNQGDGKWLLGCMLMDLATLVHAARLLDDGQTPQTVASSGSTESSTLQRFDVVFHDDSHVESIRGISLRANRELCIQNSAAHCVIDVYGALVAPNASIVGGRTHIRNRATIGNLGSTEHFVTVVTLGRSYGAAMLLSTAPSMLDAPNAELAKRLKTIEELKSAPGGKLSSAERESLTIAISEARDIERQISRIKKNLRSIQELDSKPENIRLDIQYSMHPGVVFIHGDQVVRIDREYAGPFGVIIDAYGHIAMTTVDSVVPKRFAA